MADSWSQNDKKRLLMALEQCGTKNISEIQKLLPDKTITEIRLAFKKYTLLAAKKINQDEKLIEESAINQWIKIVQKTHEKSSAIIDIIPRVLKYIALFEKRPDNAHVNLKECYLALSDLTNDTSSKRLDDATSKFFFENLSNLALKIKNENNNKRKKFIKEMKNLDQIVEPQIVKTYNRKKKKVNLILNPLHVPEELLKINTDSN